MFRRHDTIILGTFGPPPLRIPVRLAVPDLTSHVSIVGATNSGKSRLLAHIALALIARGEGVTFLDPHGDAARLVVAHLVARGVYDDPAAFRRIRYFDLPAGDAVWRYAPFNILDQPFDTPTTARLVLEAFRRAWPALEGGIAPAFENAVLAGVSVLAQHRLPVVFLHDLLTDAAWRARLLADVTDPAVRGFFARLDRWGSREQAQYLESTLRRAFLLAFSPVMRYSLGHSENRIGRFTERMNAGESLIVNLALPDPDARRLLGCLLTVFAEQAALARAATPAGERARAHTLILDEAPALISQSGASLRQILEQCRKFGLGLVMASQSEVNLPERLRQALGGVGTTVVFRVGREDAELAARRCGAVDGGRIKHAGDERAAHPVYVPLAEQWEAWTAAIQRLPPRQCFATLSPAHAWLARRYRPRVARLHTPPLPDPAVDPERLAAVEQRYLADAFELRPVIKAELASLRPAVAPATRRRTRIDP